MSPNERLAWAADWHVREETYQKAIAEVVNAHYRLPFSQHWGEGRTSSSDGQVFFAGGPKDALSQPNAKQGRASGLALLTAAIALRNAVYLERAVAALRIGGEEIPEEYLRHLSPLEWEHITLTGVYRWDLDGRVAVGADGFRPPRQPV